MFPDKASVTPGMTVRHDPEGGLLYRVDKVIGDTDDYELGNALNGLRRVLYTQLEDGGFPAGTEWDKDEGQFRANFTPLDGNEKSEDSIVVNLHKVEALKAIRVRDGITLRPLDVSDAPRILEILEADPTIRDRVSVASKMHTEEDVKTQVENYRHDEHLIRYALVEDGNPIGIVSFWRDVDNSFDAPDNPDHYGFGYFLDPAKRGGGIVPDAVKAIMDVAARNMHVEQFIAYCEDNNPDSIMVLQKLDFQPTDSVLVEQNTGWPERKYVANPY